MTYRSYSESRNLRPRIGLRGVWEQDPRGVLELKFIENQEQSFTNLERAFLHVSVLDRGGFTYGAFKYVERKELVGRRFVVNYWDGAPGILLVDVWYEKMRTAKLQASRLPDEMPELYSFYPTPQGPQPVLTLEPYDLSITEG